MNIFFNGVWFNVEYETDEERIYAMSAIVDGYDWLELLNSEAEKKINEHIAIKLKILKAEGRV